MKRRSHEPLASCHRGVTLVELCIAVAVLVVIASLAVPTVASSMARQRVVAAAQHLVGDINQARLEAAKHGLPMHVETQAGGADWCWAVTSQAGCGCNGTPLCRLKVTRASSHPGVTLSAAQSIQLNPDGTADHSISATLQAGDERVQMEVGPMGRARLCDPQGRISGMKRC